MAKGPLDKVDRLPQTNEMWEGTVRRLRAWITPRNQSPYRPYVILVVSRAAGKVVGSEIVENVPSPDQVLNVLAKAMRHPTLGGGKKRRPAVVYVDDKALVEALTPRLQEVGIRCEYQHTLREVEQAMLSMEEFMTKREPLPGLLKSPGVTPHMVKGLFEAAAFFYREAPWQWIDDARPIEVRYPPGSRPRYAIVMGHGGQVYGLAAYNSPDELRAIYAGTPPKRLLGQMEWTSLLFGEVIEVPFDDLDDMEKYGWPVAGALAYPIPVRVTRTGQPVRPGKSDLLWFEAALLAIPTFVRDRLQAEQGVLRPAESTLTVAMADGEDRIHLHYPVPGFEIVYETERTAIEEEKEAEAEAAQEHNAELLRTFEQWLTGQGLAKKTIQRHLDNVSLFAGVYMADVGGSVEISRSADQAEIVDVDEFLSAWFIHECLDSSAKALEANLASLVKFYTCLRETGLMEAEDADEILELLQADRDYYIQAARDYEGDSSLRSE